MSEMVVEIPTKSGPLRIMVSPSQPLFIVGRNGVGKSALIHQIANRSSGQVVYLPGVRRSYFDQESLSLNPATRKVMGRNFDAWDKSPDTRWKSTSGTSRNEKAIHDLTIRETQFKLDAANQIAVEGKESQAVERLRTTISPLDRANSILKQANLPVNTLIRDWELKATRDNNVYSIAEMSDGERIALVLLAEVISAPARSIFVIDEPELHMHRAIVVPLISSIIRENPESTFIVSTHESGLVSAASMLPLLWFVAPLDDSKSM